MEGCNMRKNDKNETNRASSPPQPTFTDLRGRQSVRATFRLSEKAIDAISVLSAHLGIKQKSLFDHLLEDMESLNFIARETQAREMAHADRVQKTFVISRKTLTCLERTSQVFDTPRDVLVESSIKRLLPLIEKEKKKHGNRKQVLKELGGYLKEGKALLDKTRVLLGEDDPVYEKFLAGLKSLADVHAYIDDFVKKGQIIENF
jgi:hypothetical protein